MTAAWLAWGFALVSLLAAAATIRWLDARRRAAERRAGRAAAVARLLSDAAREFDAFDDPADVLRAVPRLAEAAGIGRVSVTMPDADPIRIVAELAGAPSAKVAVPVLVGGEVLAVLELDGGAEALEDLERAAFAALARLVGDRLQRLATLGAVGHLRREAGLLTRLQESLLAVETMERATRVALDAVREALQIDAGIALIARGDRFRPLAQAGDLPQAMADALADGIRSDRGPIADAWSSRAARFVDDLSAEAPGEHLRGAGLASLALLPVLDSAGAPIALLVLGRGAPRAWPDEDRRLATYATTTLGGVLERVRLAQQLNELLSITRRLTQASSPRRLYRDVADAAVRVIPGADAASIMIAGEEGYRFVAAVGHDLTVLQGMNPLSEADQLAWHGLGTRAFRDGVPRVLSGSEVVAVSSGVIGDASQRRAFEVGGRIRELRANLCVPIADAGQVVGVLNVDSMSRADAFAPSSLRLAEAFAQQAGVIIRQVHDREALERSAVTDPVTKLGNREGFNQRLQVELARARRHGHRVSLVMLDLNGFKDVNDRLGHHVGDRALLVVADAMRRERRPFDGLFRWGGDEFAVVLPEVGPDGAGAGGQRYADAIAGVEIGGLRLTASFGTASYPEDGEDAEALLRRADDLLYHHKYGSNPFAERRRG